MEFSLDFQTEPEGTLEKTVESRFSSEHATINTVTYQNPLMKPIYDEGKHLFCNIKETLRRHPPATRFLRTVTKDQEIGGYKIPSDVATLVQCFGCCLISSDF